MKDISLKQLLEAGCHFGHQVNRWHPKAATYIYGERENVHIIDLVKTRAGLLRAAEYLRDLAKSGGSVVFVGTKRQARQVVEEAVNKVNEISKDNKSGNNFYSLLERWPGGLLTNFEVIKKNNLDAILRLRDDINNNRFVTKKEKLLAQRQLDKYAANYGGLVGLLKLPDAVFFIDVKREAGAMAEALRTKTTIVAITDTNIDASEVSYPIPANDDAVGSIKIIVDFLVEAWMEGLGEKSKVDLEKQKEEEKSK